MSGATKGKIKDVDLLISLYKVGFDVAEIAEHFGTSKQNIYYHIKKNHVVIRRKCNEHRSK